LQARRLDRQFSCAGFRTGSMHAISRAFNQCYSSYNASLRASGSDKACGHDRAAQREHRYMLCACSAGRIASQKAATALRIERGWAAVLLAVLHTSCHAPCQQAWRAPRLARLGGGANTCSRPLGTRSENSSVSNSSSPSATAASPPGAAADVPGAPPAGLSPAPRAAPLSSARAFQGAVASSLAPKQVCSHASVHAKQCCAQVLRHQSGVRTGAERRARWRPAASALCCRRWHAAGAGHRQEAQPALRHARKGSNCASEQAASADSVRPGAPLGT